MDSSFRVTYALAPEDFRAFHWFVLLRRNRIEFVLTCLVVPLGGAFVFGIVVWLQADHLITAGLGAAIMFVLVAPFWPLYVWRSIRRGARSHFANPASADDREAVIDGDGFRERSSLSDCFHTWEGVESVAVTPRHVFVFETALTAYIVPRRALPEGALDMIRGSVQSSRLHEVGG